MDENKKNVDQQWKDQKVKEKSHAENEKQAYHQPTFTVFLSSLTMQAMMALGKLENPLSGKTEVNSEQARFLIDTIEIIQEKTKNNLNAEEAKLLDESLFNLRMMYVEAKK